MIYKTHFERQFLAEVWRYVNNKIFYSVLFVNYLEFMLTSKLFKLFFANIIIVSDTLQGGPLSCNHHERSKLEL